MDGQTELRRLRRAIAVPAVARKNSYRMQIGKNMLSITTSTGDVLLEVSTSMTLNPKIRVLLIFSAIFGCRRVNCDEIDQDYMRARTAIGSCLSYEH